MDEGLYNTLKRLDERLIAIEEQHEKNLAAIEEWYRGNLDEAEQPNRQRNVGLSDAVMNPLRETIAAAKAEALAHEHSGHRVEREKVLEEMRAVLPIGWKDPDQWV